MTEPPSEPPYEPSSGPAAPPPESWPPPPGPSSASVPPADPPPPPAGPPPAGPPPAYGAPAGWAAPPPGPPIGGPPGAPPPPVGGTPPPGGQWYAGPPPAPPSNGMATAALVLGILGFVPCGPFWPICSILAIVFGAIGRKKAAETGIGAAKALWGLWLGIAALIVGGLFIAGLIALAIVAEPTTENDFYSGTASQYDLSAIECVYAGSGQVSVSGSITNEDSFDDADFNIRVQVDTDGVNGPWRGSTEVEVDAERTENWAVFVNTTVTEGQEFFCQVVAVDED